MNNTLKKIITLPLSLFVAMPTINGDTCTKPDYTDRKIVFYSHDDIAADKTKADVFAYAFVIDKNAPTVFLCPGGGYAGVCLDHEGTDIAERFVAWGYNVFVLNYRVGRAAKAPAPQDDLAALIAYALNPNNLGLHNTSYAVMGFSAGGHLAASFGATSTGYAHYNLPKPKLMILGYPVITMGKYTHKPSRMRFIGRSRKLRNLYSVEKQVNADYPNTFIWCCGDDAGVKPTNSRELAAALKASNVPCSYTEYPSGGHGIGVGIGTSAEGWLDSLFSYCKSIF